MAVNWKGDIETDICPGCYRTGREVAKDGHAPTCHWVMPSPKPPGIGWVPDVDEPTFTKPSNPKDMIGIKRFAMSVLPWNVLGWVAIALLEGAFKYRRHNYREIGVRASIYHDAALRHIMKWWEGEDYDPDITFAKVHHVDKAISSLIVVSDSIKRGNWTDDRPPKCSDGWYKELDTAVEALWKQYPNPEPPYTQVKT